MFAYILILIFGFVLFLPAALLPYTLCTFFSSRELEEMGVQLDDSDTTEFTPEMDAPSICLSVCI